MLESEVLQIATALSVCSILPSPSATFASEFSSLLATIRFLWPVTDTSWIWA